LDFALQAASTLLAADEKQFWRRLALIGAEDVGLGDIAAVGHATAALTGKTRRAELGDDWTVASCIVARLTNANKCRAADDISLVCAAHPSTIDRRIELQALPTDALIDIVLGTESFVERALALYCALGGQRRSKERVGRRHKAEDVFTAFAESGWSGSLTALARRSYLATGEMLAPFLVLLSRELKEPPVVRADALPAESGAGTIPVWAFDMFSHEGRKALLRFLQGASPCALWFKVNVSAKWRLSLLGHLLFRLEGGRVNSRIRWPLADHLRREADLHCSGPAFPDVSEALRLLWADMPALNAIRLELCRTAPSIEAPRPPLIAGEQLQFLAPSAT
jgi:hypothetical protein